MTETTLEKCLMEFRYWYNHVRTHNNLNGKTPAEMWGKIQFKRRGVSAYVFLWYGFLYGFDLPPD